jgi:hypothetical protein
MRAVQLTAYGDPVESLRYVEIPEPDAPGPNQVLIGVEFRCSIRATSCSRGASMGSAQLCQPSSGMKVSAVFSMSGPACRTSRSATVS